MCIVLLPFSWVQPELSPAPSSPGPPGVGVVVPSSPRAVADDVPSPLPVFQRNKQLISIINSNSTIMMMIIIII